MLDMMRFRLSARFNRICTSVALLVATLFLVPNPILNAPAVNGASVPAGGAPPPGSGTVSTSVYVRVIDGNTIETIIRGQQVGVKIVGIDVSPGNTACGQQATKELQALVKGGLTLEEDSSIAFDSHKLRVYFASTKDGRVVSQELVRAGVAKANNVGEAKHRFPADEATARAAKVGCVNGGAQKPSAAVPAPSAGRRNAITLPTGFAEQTVATGIDTPTAFAFAPDGRIFVAEKQGTVRVIKNGALLLTPLIDLRSRVNSYWDHGLLGIAVDPNFATNGFVYVMFTYEENATVPDGPKTARLARYTAVGDTAAPATEQVILGTQVGTSCHNFPVGADCLGSENPSHSVGAIKFASDGTLYAAMGDGASYNDVDEDALRAQNLDSLNGKILHVTATGQGISTNPFWNGTAGANRSKVWAYGLRNPFRFNLRPGSNIPYIGDVGWNDFEEINVGVAGANFGWPCYEGEGRQAGYEPKPTCQTLYTRGDAAVKFGLVTYDHTLNGQFSSSAVVGGAFYTGTAYPAQYQGAYLYGDYGQAFIRSLTVNGSNVLTGGLTDFATTTDPMSDIEIGPDGYLYFSAVFNNELRKIAYTPGLPTVKAAATPTSGNAPLTVQFSSAGSSDPNGATLTYSWNFGDNTALSTLANPSHVYAANGAYTAQLTASIPGGKSASATVTILVGAGVCPQGQYFAQYFNNATLTGTPVKTQCEVSINYDLDTITPGWGVDVSPAQTNFSVRWTTQPTFSAGPYFFSATGDDGIRVAVDGTQIINGWMDQGPTLYTTSQTMTAGPHQVTIEYYQGVGGATAKFGFTNGPTAIVTSPTFDFTYATGDVASYTGSGVDAAGVALTNANAYSWTVVIHHCPGGNCHTHYLLANQPGATGHFTVPDHGDDSYLELQLTVTDSVGRHATSSISIHPQTVQLTLNTVPQGLNVVYSGAAYTTPVTIATIPKSVRTIQAPSPQGAYVFTSWSDSSAQQHNITIGTQDMTRTATFVTPNVLPPTMPAATVPGQPPPLPVQRPTGGGVPPVETPIPLPGGR